MGFDVTAASIVLFIAATTVGSIALGAYWKDADHIEDARRVEEKRAHDLAHTNMTVTSAVYSSGPARFSVSIKNTGSTVIDISELVYLIDGTLVASGTIEAKDIGGDSVTDVWLPIETLDVDFQPVSTAPTKFQIVATSGVTANWRV